MKRWSVLSRKKQAMSSRFNQAAIWVVFLAVFPSSCWSFDEPVDFYADAIEAFDNEDFTTAVRLFTKAIEQDQKYVDAFVARGTALQMLGELDKAIDDYNEALRLNPKDSLAYVNRGSCWHDKSEFDKALADYDEAIRLDPESADAYSGRGCAWYAKGDFEKAIADQDEAI